ncbi:MAG: EamA family transporter, partial [Acidobacteria bacterium]|nr:EamA family transporter [Candidatus Sulfomarinibacter kjeldsenii]
MKVATLGFLTLVWGTTWAAITISLRGIPPFTGVALRFAIASVLLIGVARVMKIPLAATSRRERRLRLLHALLSFCVSYGVVFWCEQWVPSGLASVLFATFPLLVAVMAHFALPEERMTVPALIGTGLGFAGIAVIFAEDFDLLGGSMVALAAVVMLISPLVSATVSVAVKKWGSGMHPVPFNAVAMVMATGIMGVVAAIVERHRPVVLDPGPVAALLYMAIAGTAITFPLYFWLLEHMEARQVALIGYGTPVVALFLGAFLMGEPMTVRTWVGSAMVVVGVAVASHTGR